MSGFLKSWKRNNPIRVRNARTVLSRFVDQCKPQPVRTMREFAEQEIILPTGRFKGLRYKADRQPTDHLFFDALESGKFNRTFGTGPSQAGKSLRGYVIPTMYHLFEIGETVICAVPKMAMARDKWREDFEPTIKASRYRDLIPKTGVGSRGGDFDAIQFLNGATLKFMSGGGDDKTRASFTSRVVVMTETDGMDESGAKSRESDKISQIEARTNSYDQDKMIYGECTVSVEKGRIWTEYTTGTQSRIMVQCPSCNSWISPEREDLKGWQDCDDALEAEEKGYFCCSDCGHAITEPEREKMNVNSRLIHKGQEITPDGTIVGTEPRTRTLGFRFSAFNNLFQDPGSLASLEWEAERAEDRENAEKRLKQFYYATPWEPPVRTISSLETFAISERVSKRHARSVYPSDATSLVVGVDVSQRWLHFVTKATLNDSRSVVLEHGTVRVHSEQQHAGDAIVEALNTLWSRFQIGIPSETGVQKTPDQFWVDSGHKSTRIYEFCTNADPEICRPIKGAGTRNSEITHYNTPAGTGSIIHHIGEGYHFRFMRDKGICYVLIDANHWKSEVHNRLEISEEANHAEILYNATSQEHREYARHLTAETKKTEFKAGSGWVEYWQTIRKQNHFFDASYIASCAEHYQQEEGGKPQVIGNEWFQGRLQT